MGSEMCIRDRSKIDPKISIATVYRTVKILEEAGILIKHDFKAGKARYEQIQESHHDHLIDIKTGEINDFAEVRTGRTAVAGSVRGAHNCGSCDKEVAAAIERYSVSNSLSEFEGISCECEAQWKAEIDLDTSLPIPLGSGLDRRLDAVEVLLSP